MNHRLNTDANERLDPEAHEPLNCEKCEEPVPDGYRTACERCGAM